MKLDDINENRLNKELKYILQSLTYMTWPAASGDENTFWKKLKLTLMKRSSSYSNVLLNEC